MTNVIRPVWTPDTDEQRKLLTDAIRAARRARKADAERWTAILRARIAGVPDEILCDEAGESRATLNRRYGSRRAMAVRWDGNNFEDVKLVRPDARLTPDGDLEIERVDRVGEYVVVGRNYVVHRREEL